MVSALSRKELNQTIIERARLYNAYAWDKAASAAGQIPEIAWADKIVAKGQASEDNFPYALREFINSHPDLPTLDELTGTYRNARGNLSMAT